MRAGLFFFRQIFRAGDRWRGRRRQADSPAHDAGSQRHLPNDLHRPPLLLALLRPASSQPRLHELDTGDRRC